jgi:hypothetical protein
MLYLHYLDKSLKMILAVWLVKDKHQCHGQQVMECTVREMFIHDISFDSYIPFFANIHPVIATQIALLRGTA